MDLGTAIIGMVCIAVCTTPFVLTSRSRKKRKRQLLESIKDLAKEQNSEITQHEICGNYAIGLDEVKNFLFFHSKGEGETKQQVIDLGTIDHCSVSKRKSKNQTIERLDLKFSQKDKKKAEVVLGFYNADSNFQLFGELESIEKWNELINKRLVKDK